MTTMTFIAAHMAVVIALAALVESKNAKEAAQKVDDKKNWAWYPVFKSLPPLPDPESSNPRSEVSNAN